MGPDAPFPLIVSYYTLDPIYEPAAERLKASLDRFGLEYRIEGMERFGGYHDHCFIKAGFLRRMLDAYRRPVFWTDADNEFLQFPEMLGGINTDIGLARFFRWDRELSTTVMYLDDKPVVRDLLSDWDRANRENCITWTADQLNFHRVVQDYLSKRLMSITLLPWSYYQSVDSEVKETPVIWQHQASREGREYAPSAP